MNKSNNDLSSPLLNLTDRTTAGVSPLEQEVLDEYTRLLNNMNHVCHYYSGTFYHAFSTCLFLVSAFLLLYPFLSV